jgi:hypothetical protein
LLVALGALVDRPTQVVPALLPHPQGGGYGPGYCDIPNLGSDLYVLASVWNRHPDYLPQWAPTAEED